MRKLFTYVLVAVALAGFTSCSDDNDEPKLFELPAENKTLTPADGLTMISNGQSLSDVSLQYLPAADGKSATLIIEGSNAATDRGRAESPVIAPGDVLPGAAQVILTVTPKFEIDRATFEGDAESDYCTFHYDGTITATTVNVNFTNIVMKNGVIISTLSFTDSDVDHMLELTYNAASLMGKMVTFKPDSSNFNKAVLTLAGQTLDLSDLLKTAQLPVDLSKIAQIPTPGVLPGTASFELPVTLGEDNSFSGSAETDFVTFKYEGTVATEKLVLNITEAKLKNAPLSESKWYVPVMNTDYENDPLHLVWESDSAVKIELFPGFNMDMPIAYILGITCRLQILPDGESKASVTAMLSRALKSVDFGADGNITAGYVDKGIVGGPVIESPAGLAQYVMASDSTMLLFLNPQAIIMDVMKAQSQAAKSRAIDFSKFQSTIDAVAEMLVKCVVEGIPVQYSIPEGDTEHMSVYLPTEFVKPLLMAVSPVFQDEEVVNTIINLASSDPSFGSMSGMLGGAIKSLPDVIEGTTQVELSINLVKTEPVEEDPLPRFSL